MVSHYTITQTSIRRSRPPAKNTQTEQRINWQWPLHKPVQSHWRALREAPDWVTSSAVCTDLLSRAWSLLQRKNKLIHHFYNSNNSLLPISSSTHPFCPTQDPLRAPLPPTPSQLEHYGDAYIAQITVSVIISAGNGADLCLSLALDGSEPAETLCPE